MNPSLNVKNIILYIGIKINQMFFDFLSGVIFNNKMFEVVWGHSSAAIV